MRFAQRSLVLKIEYYGYVRIERVATNILNSDLSTVQSFIYHSDYDTNHGQKYIDTILCSLQGQYKSHIKITC